MVQSGLQTGAEFRRRFVLETLMTSAGTTLLISAYLMALIRLPSEQWWGFGQIVGGLFVVLFVVQDRVNRGLWGPIGALALLRHSR